MKTLCKHKENRDLLKLGFETLGKLLMTKQCVQQLMKADITTATTTTTTTTMNENDNSDDDEPDEHGNSNGVWVDEKCGRNDRTWHQSRNNGCVTNCLSFFVKLLQYDESAILVVDHGVPFLFELIERKNINSIIALLMTDIFDRLAKGSPHTLHAFLEYENCCGHILAF
ncbi:hypothetical protein RFI_14348, partial [Reticulomyxa filosa]